MATLISGIRIQNQPEKANVVLDHLSRVELGEDPIGINEDLLDEHLFRVEAIL